MSQCNRHFYGIHLLGYEYKVAAEHFLEPHSLIKLQHNTMINCHPISLG